MIKEILQGIGVAALLSALLEGCRRERLAKNAVVEPVAVRLFRDGSRDAIRLLASVSWLSANREQSLVELDFGVLPLSSKWYELNEGQAFVHKYDGAIVALQIEERVFHVVRVINPGL